MNLPALSTFLLSTLLPCATALAQNQCIHLQNGVDGYLELPYSPAFVPTTGITVEAWATYDESTLQAGYTWPTIARQDIGAQQESWVLRIEAGQNANTRLIFKVRTTSGFHDTSWNFNPGQMLNWTHVAGTYDGVAVRLIVNGVEVSSNNAPSGILRDQQGVLRVGKGADANLPAGETWNGDIDELRIWPFARSAQEIAASMNDQLQTVPGIVAVWSFDGNYNDSANGHNLTATGSVSFAPGAPALVPLPVSGALHFGMAQPGCHGATTTSIGAVPRVGLQDFAIYGLGAPSNGSGIVMTSFAPLTQPLTFLGADVWVDLTQGGFIVGVPGGPLGASRIPIPIPAVPTLAGGQLFFQFAWLDTNCTAPLWSSDGLHVIVLP